MPDIRHLVPIDAPPEVVYRLVTSPAGLAQWWAEDVGAPDAGGAIELGFFHRVTVYRLEPVELQPSHTARWLCTTGNEWHGTHIEYRLEALPTGTRLRFAHAGWRQETDFFTSCNTTWGELMFRLKAAAEGKGSGPLFSRDGLAY